MQIEKLTAEFVNILQCASAEETLVSPDESLQVILMEQVDPLDFELAVVCFEATHRVALDYADLNESDFGRLTIRTLIKDYLVTESAEISDPLFVTKRIAMFRDAIFDAFDEDAD